MTPRRIGRALAVAVLGLFTWASVDLIADPGNRALIRARREERRACRSTR